MINGTDINQEKDAGAAVLHREMKKMPTRSWRTWLIGRPLTDTDVPQQTCDIFPHSEC
jgi:hypothetical protein